jgi:hypothetical protein
LKVVQDLYRKAKSCAKTNAGLSPNFFFSNIGLRQGENVSPVLYSIFINDLKEFLATDVTSLTVPFTLANEFLFEDIDAFVRFFCASVCRRRCAFNRDANRYAVCS